jgi:hypothetical protein
LENVVDLLGKSALTWLAQVKQVKQQRTYRKHLISLVKDEHLHVVGLQDAALNHILDTTWRSDDYLWAILQSLHVITNVGAADAGMAFDVHEVADGDNDFLDLLSKLTSRCKNQSLACFEVLVDLLEDRDREGCGFASSGLSLCDDIRS